MVSTQVEKNFNKIDDFFPVTFQTIKAFLIFSNRIINKSDRKI